ncbi:hypothetical protein M3P36_00765 [Altererythrobacter sp. KTW20L]|uniref:hypothetical protein n=1 Tax=Altererythrobacter sp. KTW20L TaxID=2942210 RepID=UPI0020BECFB2|nr:hypothetical protein [Altererythrobacter sp. KTW20L]MCL6249581.1 hypothetical protein [Altererythrobacter sp. KTW20L]
MKSAHFLALPFMAVLAACGNDAEPVEADPAAEAQVTAADPSGQYAPRNDCAEVAGAQAFLDEVNAAVAARDVDAFVNLADVHVRLGFGGEDGAANLRQSFEANDGGMWDEIATLMVMGCAVTEGGEFTTITLPWYFAQDMTGDPFETMIVTGEDVAIHEAAALTSPPLATVSWEAVQLVLEPGSNVIEFGGPDDNNGWRRVRLPAGGGAGADPVEGYMPADALRSLVDYRLLAHDGDGRWKISALLAGD